MINLKFTSLAITIFLLFSASNLQCEELIKKENKDQFQPDSETELKDFLEQKKDESQPFKESEIDLEMLGLDDVKEVYQQNIEQEKKSTDVDKGVASKDKEQAKNIAQDEDGSNLGDASKPLDQGQESIKDQKMQAVKEQKSDNNQVVTKKDPAKEEVKKTNSLERQKKETRGVEQDSGVGGFFGKIKSFVNAKEKNDRNGKKKKIVIKLGGGDDKKVEQSNDKKKQEEERFRILAEQKKARLEKLRKEYLVEISDQKYIVNYNEEMIKPKKKDLGWSNSFYVTREVAPPILSRDRSKDNSHIPIIPTFKERVYSLFSTIKVKDTNAFNDMYSKISIPDLRNGKGDTILTYSSLLKRHPVMLSILSKGADPDLPNMLGHTPLDIAIENMDYKSVKILIDNHANISYADKYNRTYLMLAARKGYLPIVQILVEKGSKVNKLDSYGRTALSIAYRHKKEVIAKYLLSNGAKTWIEKPFTEGSQELIKELENRWNKPIFNSQ